jgi:putative FmdB family regulatory protein
MPIYEYRCTKCGQTLEKIQKLGDAPLTRCPTCSGGLEKLFSVAAFQLKGGGWYSDGYSRKDGSAKGESKPGGESKSSGEGSSGEGGKSEPKKAAAGGCGSGSCGCH